MPVGPIVKIQGGHLYAPALTALDGVYQSHSPVSNSFPVPDFHSSAFAVNNTTGSTLIHTSAFKSGNLAHLVSDPDCAL